MGNVRALAYWNGDLLKTNQWSDYYPYGHKMASSTGELGNYRFGYQGDFAEEDEETGWNFFEARTYDPVIGRWMAVDWNSNFTCTYYSQVWFKSTLGFFDDISFLKVKFPYHGISEGCIIIDVNE
nr:RHS repeat-associated core domain-containing protein [Flammeovirga kamogawensis]